MNDKHVRLDYLKYILCLPVLAYMIYKYVTTKNDSFLYVSIIYFLCLVLVIGYELIFGNEQINRYINELRSIKEELNLKNIELTCFNESIQVGYLETVMALANSIEAKDPYTRGHCQRVMEISCEIGKALGLSDEQIEDLRYASILHDIGKIGISASILNKQGKLTDEEFDEIKKHPQIAYNILKDVKFIKNGLDAILQHHERYDGKGYPSRLKAEEICLYGRILCIADAFDAMTSDRPYRKGMAMEEALSELQRCKGTQFDPVITDVFINLSMGIKESHNG